jgi:DNA repair protein SbcC/Rad50
MLIERLEFIGFGNLTGQRVDFRKDKLNVLVENNEYGKSTIAEAIWAILYDYPPERYEGANKSIVTAKKPLSGAAFKGLIDVEVGDRRLRLIRDFSERRLQILDLSKDLARAEADVTAEFMKDITPEELGLKLTGLGRDLFRSTCMVGQRELDRDPFGADRNLSSLLLNIADSAGAATTAFAAINALEETLNAFPFNGSTYKMDDLVSGLARGRDLLVERIKQLESEKAGVARDIDRLAELEDRLDKKTKDVNAEEYFQLCFEAAELDSRLMKAQERKARVEELRNQTGELQYYENFPIHRVRQIDELWTKRQARIGDLNRLQAEMENRRIESQTRDLEFRERAEGLAEFTAADAQALTSLGRTLQQVSADIEEARNKREREYQRVRGSGVDFSGIGGVRKSLLTLEAKELDDAHAFHDMILAAKDRVVECERGAERARTILTEIRTNRDNLLKTLSRGTMLTGGGAVLCALVILILMVAVHSSVSSPLIVAFGTIAVILVMGAVACMSMIPHVKQRHRAEDEEVARIEDHKQSAAAADMQAKIRNLEARMEELARKAGVKSGQDLVKCIQEYATSAAQLKDLDLLEQMVASREAHAQSLAAEVKGYFQKAGRHIDNVTARSALELADAVNRYLDDARRAQSSSELLDHRFSELRFLEDEIRDLDALLFDHFSKADLKFENIEQGYQLLGEAVTQYRRWEAAAIELNRFEQDTTSDMTPDELPKIIERLENKRRDIWGRMQQLIVANPEIVTTMAPINDNMISSLGKEMSDLRASLDELRRQRDEVQVQVRVATKNYDDYYLKSLEELEVLEKDLDYVTQSKIALTLARDTFVRLAEETHAAWAKKLTEISREMLKSLGTEYESLEFDTELRLTVRRRGQRDLLNDWQMLNQLSGGTREQVHCLARMAVVRFLSKNYRLPIVMDEPFSEFDDERFLKIMRFLINNMLSQNQIIIFSCHQQRHDWMVEQLTSAEAQLIGFCRLESLKADAVARR